MRRSVLIIDDDTLILAALERQLAASYDVVVLDDPAHALTQIRDGVSFDVILVDLLMPAMNGVQFHAELERCVPALAARIVLMTGGTSRRDAMELVEASRLPTLAKPFDVESLRRLIDRVTAT